MGKTNITGLFILKTAADDFLLFARGKNKNTLLASFLRKDEVDVFTYYMENLLPSPLLIEKIGFKSEPAEHFSEMDILSLSTYKKSEGSLYKGNSWLGADFRQATMVLAVFVGDAEETIFSEYLNTLYDLKQERGFVIDARDRFLH